MQRTPAQLRDHAERIWRAGVAAVQPDRLIRENVAIDGNTLVIADEIIDLQSVRRIAIVGAGKAAGAMGIALENAFGPRMLQEKQVTGWINVPADCVRPAQCITIHPARPAGINEPRPEGVEGTRKLLDIVASLGADDLCLCVLTGGGSALLPAPVPQITLDDKIRVTRRLSAAGANIEQLNAVRRPLSLVKGGGLARACKAGKLVTLIISDVLGDSLEAIASGPTVVANHSSATAALDMLKTLDLLPDSTFLPIVTYLEQQARDERFPAHPSAQISNVILGNNATAVDAAGVEAEKLGYSHAMISGTKAEGPAEGVGHHLADMALRMRDEAGPDCLISGGEPTVTLVDESRRGKGGRNQQLALAALAKLGDGHDIALLSAGTDGEDGPTNAAGAFVTGEIVRSACKHNLDPENFLARNDAYHFFAQTGGLFITGPTMTNVCDLRIVTVSQAR